MDSTSTQEPQNQVTSTRQTIDIFFKSTGDAPILTKKKWKVQADQTVAFVITFLRKCLQLRETDSIFVYVNQSFSPSPDTVVRNLYDCFGSDNKLTLHYARSQAWG